MAAAIPVQEQDGVAAPKKSVWRMVRENPYIFGLSMVIWQIFSIVSRGY